MRIDTKAVRVLREESQSVLAVLKQLMETKLFSLAKHAVIDRRNGNSCVGQFFYN